MPITHLLGRLYGDNLAHCAAVNQRLDLLIKHRIAQHMADNHMPVSFKGEALNLQALLRIGGNGLFQQQMVIKRKRLHRVRIMQMVRRADKKHICQPPRSEHLLCTGVALGLCQAVLPLHLFELFRPRIRRRNNFHSARQPFPTAGVCIQPTRTAARNRYCNRFHT